MHENDPNEFHEISLSSSPRTENKKEADKQKDITPAPYFALLPQGIFIAGLITAVASTITLLLVLFAPPIAFFLFVAGIIGTGATITIGGSIWYVWTQSFQQKNRERDEDTKGLINYAIHTPSKPL